MPTAISYPKGKIPRSQTSPAEPSGSWLRVRYLTVGQHCSHKPLAHRLPPSFPVRGTQWELNHHKARGTWPVLREGGEEAIFIALALIGLWVLRGASLVFVEGLGSEMREVNVTLRSVVWWVDNQKPSPRLACCKRVWYFSRRPGIFRLGKQKAKSQACSALF